MWNICVDETHYSSAASFWNAPIINAENNEKKYRKQKFRMMYANASHIGNLLRIAECMMKGMPLKHLRGASAGLSGNLVWISSLGKFQQKIKDLKALRERIKVPWRRQCQSLWEWGRTCIKDSLFTCILNVFLLQNRGRDSSRSEVRIDCVRRASIMCFYALIIFIPAF